jgi:hypothetical protein
MIKNVHWSPYAVPVILFRFQFIFLDSFSKNTQISNFMKIRPVGAELFHVERRAALGNFANSPIKSTRSFIVYRAL